MPSKKVILLEQFLPIRESLASVGKKIVFTNGCFDLIHRGHIDYLRLSKNLGDILVVGLNSDRSVRRIKGPGRPITPEEDRAEILAALDFVDYIILFDEDTPFELIKAIVPDILAKGADWSENEIVGAEIVKAAGGEVARIPLTPGKSTSGLIGKILDTFGREKIGE